MSVKPSGILMPALIACVLSAGIWMRGGFTWEAQRILLAGAAMCAVAAVLRCVHERSWPAIPKQLVWMLFLGLAFLAWNLIAALNPALDVSFDGWNWILHERAHVAWLPKSIAGPVDGHESDFVAFSNAWRMVCILGTVWLLSFAAASGLGGRREAWLLLRVLLAHALVVSVVTLVHAWSGSDLVLWRWSDSIYHKGTAFFHYENTAASLQVLLVSIGAACIFAGGAGLRRGLGLAVCMILLSGALVALNSLAAMGLAIAGVLGGFLLSHPVFKGWHERFGGEPRIGFTLVVAAVLLLGALMWFTSEPGAGGKGALLLHGGHFRQIIHSIARQMAMAAPITGNGANSLVYLLPEYHPLVPEFRAHLYETQPDLNRILLMHVDGDWMEFLVEHGFVGTSIALASMLAAFAAALQGGRAGLCIAMGVAAVLFHGAVDSVLREPVILAHIGVLCGLAPLLAPAKDGCKTR